MSDEELSKQVDEWRQLALSAQTLRAHLASEEQEGGEQSPTRKRATAEEKVAQDEYLKSLGL